MGKKKKIKEVKMAVLSAGAKEMKGHNYIKEEDVGKSFYIYNGKMDIELFVNTNMVNKRFGEFVFTRTGRSRRN